MDDCERMAERLDWIDHKACEIVSRATTGWNEFDADADATPAWEERALQTLTIMGFIKSRFAVSAVGKAQGVAAELVVTATGPTYWDAMSQRINAELTARWGADQWEVSRRLSEWRLTFEGENLQDFFKNKPQQKHQELSERISEVLDKKLWSSVEIDEVTRVEIARPVPNWDEQSGELTFNGQLIRKWPRMATGVYAVLNVFQELGWPPRIDDPVTGGANPERVNNTCKSLRLDLKQITFRADGSGKGYRWEALPAE
jgi:hypothetical protein